MARISGTNLRIYTDGGVPLGYATSCTFDGSTSMTEVIHKDSVGNFADKDPSTQSWTMSTEGFISEDDTINGESKRDISWIRSAWINRTRLYLQWTTGTSGEQTMNGYGYITSLSESAPVNETATYSVTIEGDGAVSLGSET